MKIKQISTGNNDSLEDIMIAIMNLKTEDGKLVGMRESYEVVKQFMDLYLLTSKPMEK
jgi:hypothetical protein